MKKRSIVFFALLIVMIFVTSVPSFAASRGDALLVYGLDEIGPGDLAVKARLEQLGFTVTTIFAPETNSASADGKAVIFIAESITSADVADKFLNSAVPVVVSEPGLFDDMKMGNFSQLDGFEGEFKVVTESHEVAAGLKGTFKPFSAAAGPGYLTDQPASAVIIAELDTGEKTLTLFDKGAEMLDGFVNPEKRAAYYIRGQDAQNATEDTWKVFDALINWMAPLPAAADSGTGTTAATASKTGDSSVLVIAFMMAAIAGLSMIKFAKKAK